MTSGDWVTLTLGVIGIVGTWLFGAFMLGRTAGKIEEKIVEHIALIKEEYTLEIAQLRSDFVREQSAQDRTFGEVGAAMRQKIADVEKEMHSIEIWGRDNFVRLESFDELRMDIKAMAADIKRDFADLIRKIEASRSS